MIALFLMRLILGFLWSFSIDFHPLDQTFGFASNVFHNLREPIRHLFYVLSALFGLWCLNLLVLLGHLLGYANIWWAIWEFLNTVLNQYLDQYIRQHQVPQIHENLLIIIRLLLSIKQYILRYYIFELWEDRCKHLLKRYAWQIHI